MSFLNYFFMFLSSPNNIFILSFCFTFLEVFLTMLIFTSILNFNSNKKQKFLYVIIFSFLAISSKLFIPIPLNIFLNLFISPILIACVFKTTFLKSILSEIIPFFIYGIIGSLLICILNILIPNMSKYIFNIPLYKIIYSLSLYFFIYIVYILIKKYKIKIKITDIISVSSFKTNIIFINIIIGIFTIFLESYMLSLYGQDLPIILSFTSILVLFIYFTLSMYSLIRTSKLEILNQNLKQSKLYNKTLKTLYNNLSLFKHNFNNIIQSIGGYIESQDIKGLQEYYLEVFNDCQKNNNLSLLDPTLFNNPAIFNLISSKYYQADSLTITFSCNMFLNLNKINIKVYDLTKILGIFLDNSIEASKKCKDKFINIEMYTSFNNSKTKVILIKNSCIAKDININRIFEKNYSSKKSKQNGLGLWEINMILKKYDNIKLYTSYNKNIFQQKLEFYE